MLTAVKNLFLGMKIRESYLTSQTFTCHICKIEILSLPFRVVGTKMRLKSWKYPGDT